MNLSSLQLRQRRFGSSYFQSLKFGRRLLSSHSSLSNWHRAVSQVPLHKVLPLGFGGVTDYANIAAYYGDKRIGYEVAMELEKLCDAAATTTTNDATIPEGTIRPSPAWLTSISQQALSNELFSEKLSDILPLHSQKVSAELVQTQVHDGGTMVEAAIDAVAKLENSQENRDDGNTNNNSQEETPQQAALSELARYLIQTTLVQGPANAKGRLLEAGGTVKAEEVDNSNSSSQKQHEPWFRAVAHLGGTTSHAEGRNKRKAEQAASAKVLQLISTTSGADQRSGDSSTFFSTTERVNLFVQVEVAQDTTEEGEAEEDDNDSNLFWEATLDEQSAAMNLRNGESPEEWWRRGAIRPKSAHHRAMMAAFVFPDQVAAVQCWIRRPHTPNTRAPRERTAILTDNMLDDAATASISSTEDEAQSDACSSTTAEHGCTILMVVIGHPLSTGDGDNDNVYDNPQQPVISSFVEHGPSRSRAVKLAGTAVNRFIATEILGWEDPLNEEGTE